MLSLCLEFPNKIITGASFVPSRLACENLLAIVATCKRTNHVQNCHDVMTNIEVQQVIETRFVLVQKDETIHEIKKGS